MQREQDTERLKIMDVLDWLSAGMIAKDTVALNRILDKEYTLTHITGYVQSRDEWLHEIAKESMKYYSVQNVSRKIDINGDTAVILARNKVDARIWGSRHVWPLQLKMNLEKRKDNWIILNAVASVF